MFSSQAILQMILGLLRFLTVAAIVIYSIGKMIEGDQVCQVDSHFYEDLDVANNYTSERDIVVKFDPRGWVTAIPVMTYAFILHQGLASLTHPIKQKQYLWYLTTAMFGVALFCYMILGIVVPLWFKESIQETVTLNFVSCLLLLLFSMLLFILLAFVAFSLFFHSSSICYL